MKTAHEIILAPVITERSGMEQAHGRYIFYVANDATKPEIARAAEQLFDVKVLKVNTIKAPAKPKRVRYHMGLTPVRKKAVVTIDMDPKAETYIGKGGKESTTGRKYKTSIEEFGFNQ